jgi:hypothetical protein
MWKSKKNWVCLFYFWSEVKTKSMEIEENKKMKLPCVGTAFGMVTCQLLISLLGANAGTHSSRLINRLMTCKIAKVPRVGQRSLLQWWLSQWELLLIWIRDAIISLYLVFYHLFIPPFELVDNWHMEDPLFFEIADLDKRCIAAWYSVNSDLTYRPTYPLTRFDSVEYLGS